MHSAPACLSCVAPEVLQGGAGGQFGSSPLPQLEPSLLLLLPLLLPPVAPVVLQGGAGGQFGSSPLPQPEPPLVLVLVLFLLLLLLLPRRQPVPPLQRL